MDEIEFMDKVEELTRQFSDDMTKTRKESKYTLHLNHDDITLLNMLLDPLPQSSSNYGVVQLNFELPNVSLKEYANLRRRIHKLWWND